MQYIKDRTMNALMIIFHAEKKRNVKLKHVINWLNLFVDYHNKEINLK
jgi:putative transposase